MKHRRTLTRALTIATGVALGLNLMSGTASATTPPVRPLEAPTTATSPSEANFECPAEENLNNVTGHGANNNDGYQSTCDEADFGGNGQEFGPGLQTGKPCAGCVGQADDKNPPGQFPDGSDHNSGYECDGRDRPFEDQNGNGNHGVGDENPAHTGCLSTTINTPAAPLMCPDSDVLMTDSDGDGTADEGSCDSAVVVMCPDSDVVMTDSDGDGTADEGSCDLGSDGGSEAVVVMCPETDTPMTDVNGDNVVNADDCTPLPAPTCPDGSPMTDTDGNGNINSADCNKVIDKVVDNGTTTDTPVTEPEIEALVVVIGPTTPSHVEETVQVLGTNLEATVAVTAAEVTAAPAVPAERSVAVLGVQAERPGPAPAAVPLARTGANNGFLALLAFLLLALGSGLVRVGGRRPIAS